MAEAPAPPYLGPPAHDSGRGNKPIHRVVIHGTVSPTERGGARNIARYFQRESAGGSAHYTVDPYETIQAAWDSVICWHAPPNSHSIGVELCFMVAVDDDFWDRREPSLMLARAARLVRGLCQAYDVPMDKVTPAQLRAGKHGICGHDDVRDAWGQTDHWDPGPNFPWARFMRMVRDDTTTDPIESEEDDMPNYSDWSKEDREALAGDVAEAVWESDRINPPGPRPKNNLKAQAGYALGKIWASVERARKEAAEDQTVYTDDIRAALAELLARKPAGLTQADISDVLDAHAVRGQVVVNLEES